MFVNNNLSYGRGYVYNIQYHIVWCTKYRKPVLINETEQSLKVLKGNSARAIFIANPDLKKQLLGGHLWNPSYFIATVSDNTRKQVQEYIASQKIRN